MENIEVALRIRPQNQSEIKQNDIEIWHQHDQKSLQINQTYQQELIKSGKLVTGHKNKFIFNHIFDKNKSTEDIYNQVIRRIAISSLQGINGTVFMYGQTGSGKTFSMMGYREKKSLKQETPGNANFLNKFSPQTFMNKQQSRSYKFDDCKENVD